MGATGLDEVVDKCAALHLVEVGAVELEHTKTDIREGF